MSVFKEEIIQLETWAKQQHRIWPDSCDIGIEAKPEIKKRMHEIVKALRNLEPGCGEVWRSITKARTQIEYVLGVRFEMDGPTIKFHVNYYKENKPNGLEFFSIW
jgi:hypothetical protein